MKRKESDLASAFAATWHRGYILPSLLRGGMLMLLLVLSIGTAIGQNQDDKVAIKSFFTGRYVNEVTQILFNPQDVTFSNLIEAGNEAPADSLLDLYWQRAEGSHTLTPEEQSKLFALLLYNTANYERGMVRMSGPYSPKAEFKLTRDGKNLNVLISPSDQTWVILYNGVRVFRNRYDNSIDIEKFIQNLSAAVLTLDE